MEGAGMASDVFWYEWS